MQLAWRLPTVSPAAKCGLKAPVPYELRLAWQRDLLLPQQRCPIGPLVACSQFLLPAKPLTEPMPVQFGEPLPRTVDQQLVYL